MAEIEKVINKVIDDLKWWRDTNEEMGVVYIPDYAVDSSIERLCDLIVQIRELQSKSKEDCKRYHNRGYQQGKSERRYLIKEDGSIHNLDEDIEKAYQQGRADAIEEILKQVEFEEKWLSDAWKDNGCKYSSRDVDMAFDGIKHKLSQLKGAEQ